MGYSSRVEQQGECLADRPGDLPCVKRASARCDALKLSRTFLVSEDWIKMNCPNICFISFEEFAISQDKTCDAFDSSSFP